VSNTYHGPYSQSFPSNGEADGPVYPFAAPHAGSPSLGELAAMNSEAHHVARDAHKMSSYPLLGQLIYDELVFRAGLHWSLDSQRMRALLDEARRLLVLVHTSEPEAAA
jgi:hypothetical protein